MEWEFWISRCRLLYVSIEWINNRVLLYSTGNYIQYPVINHNGKEYEKEERNMSTLKSVVREIYRALRKTEEYLLRETNWIGCTAVMPKKYKNTKGLIK